MKKEINKVIIDVLFVFMFVFISVPVWEANAQRIPEVVEVEEIGLTLLLKEERKVDLFNISEKYDKYDPISFLIHNYNNNPREGQLVLKYSQSSTLKYSNLNVVLNSDLKPLAELPKLVIDDYYVFLLNDLDVASNSTEEITISLWMDMRASRRFRSQTFTYALSVIQRQLLDF